MKKIFLIIIMFMISPVFVNAVVPSVSDIDEVCNKEKGCLLMCKYNVKNGKDSANAVIVYRHKNVKYDPTLFNTGKKTKDIFEKKEKFLVLYSNRLTTEQLADLEYLLLYASLYYFLPKETDGLGTETEAALQKGECPAYAFYDETGLSSEICFSNTSNGCKSKNDAGTDYNGSTSKITYNFMDEVKKYTESVSSKKYSCDDLMVKSNDIEGYAEELTTDGLLNLFKKNTFPTSKIPSLYKNSETYGKLIEAVKLSITQQSSECVDKEKEKIEKYKKEGTMTEEEYEAALAALNDKQKKLDQQAKEYSTAINPSEPNIDVNINVDASGCGIISNDFREFLQWILDLIRIAGLVLTIVLGVLDYAKASFANKEDAMKEANKNFSTRILCLGLLLLVPAIINLILTIFDIGIFEGTEDITCGLK